MKTQATAAGRLTPQQGRHEEKESKIEISIREINAGARIKITAGDFEAHFPATNGNPTILRLDAPVQKRQQAFVYKNFQLDREQVKSLISFFAMRKIEKGDWVEVSDGEVARFYSGHCPVSGKYGRLPYAIFTLKNFIRNEDVIFDMCSLLTGMAVEKKNNSVFFFR